MKGSSSCHLETFTPTPTQGHPKLQLALRSHPPQQGGPRRGRKRSADSVRSGCLVLLPGGEVAPTDWAGLEAVGPKVPWARHCPSHRLPPQRQASQRGRQQLPAPMPAHTRERPRGDARSHQACPSQAPGAQHPATRPRGQPGPCGMRSLNPDLSVTSTLHRVEARTP